MSRTSQVITEELQAAEQHKMRLVRKRSRAAPGLACGKAKKDGIDDCLPVALTIQTTQSFTKRTLTQMSAMTSIFLCTDARMSLHAPPEQPKINDTDDADDAEQHVETAPRLTALLERLQEMEWTLLQRQHPWMSQTSLAEHLSRHSTSPTTR